MYAFKAMASIKFRHTTNTAKTGGCLNESNIIKIIDITAEIEAIIKNKIDEYKNNDCMHKIEPDYYEIEGYTTNITVIGETI
jgi:hypothetical protein